ncbi:1-deoxy-D-xylulose-5-phosphate synthase [Nocardia suismassiliense]|uniref:1-deoxy-D-xylulose-5-phosphate synthase n=1 Tax=Nocardia suismassiliense TaxID=2077092 RepID=UPI000D1DB837|nr:1-deoxy-D-xylulose-5-phosphate synthase [Nocardia suismassiliense]
MSTTISAPEEADQLLEQAQNPAQLRKLSPAQLSAVADQIRQVIIDTVNDFGGHLGPNLGVVELTIALHRVFESPRDTLLFDTGHQTYPHKLLTGRLRTFAHSLRQPGGLSGYPNRAESPHDVIENSHASTALAYADGIAKAHQLNQCADRAVVAIVGDGALTGGLAYEALNNLGAAPDRPVTVVLNDNGYSYSPTAGAVATHLALLSHQLTEVTDPDPARIRPSSNIFEQLGLAYLGPVDGHDIAAVESALHAARRLARPAVVHVVTVKGKGYEPAVRDQEKLHTTGPRVNATTWTDVFTAELTAIAERRSDIVAITAAMAGPTGLRSFAQRFPHRCFDVGLAEQHAVTSAAGLAMAGKHPVVTIYSTFLNRAFDQILMDVALHRLPVTFVLDRAGVTGPDGASHHGMWDISVLGIVPGMRIAAPRDATQLRELLNEAVACATGPTAVRFPKAAAGAEIAATERIGCVDILARADRPEVLLIAVGPLGADCIEACRQLSTLGIDVTVADPRWIVPVPPELIELGAPYEVILTVEDNTRSSGVGTAIAQSFLDAGHRTPVYNLGLPAQFLPHGSRSELLDAADLSARGIVATIHRLRAQLRGRRGGQPDDRH